MLTYSSPKRIVVRHVLLQLLVPRHPPCALTNLTTNLLIFHIRLMSFSTIHLINIVDVVLKTSFSIQPQYLVFKELFLERYDLSKPSKTSSTVS